MKIDNFVLIIGAMKCGTTSLFSYLCQHPEIASPIFKEPNFFSYDERWNKGWEWYLSRWHNWSSHQHKVAIEASINYSKCYAYPEAISRIKSMSERAKFKFIYIVRNPIDRIESHYTHAQTAFWGAKIMSLNEGIDPELIETSKYAKQISQYYQAFPQENILILNFNDLKSHPEKILRQICVFLEIDPDYQFQSLDKVYNSNQSHIVDVKWWRALRPVKPLRKISKLVPKEAKQQMRRLVGGKQIKSNFKLTEAQKNFVLNELNEDLKTIVEEYGVDISSWNIKVKV